MAESIVSLTYGKALFEAAKERHKEEIIGKEMKTLVELINTTESLEQFLNNPTIYSTEKKKTIQMIFGEEFQEETINFLFVLIDKGRTNEIERISRRYAECYDRELGQSEGKIFSVLKLSDEQVQKFEEQVSKLFRKKIKLKNEVDPSLIGGIKIQADGKMIDQSLKADLDKLLNQLNNN